MNIDSLKYFLGLYHANSLNTAAENMFISRQGLGKSMKQLERELGGQLFFVNSKGISPTEFGHFFATRVEAAMDSIDSLSDAFELYEYSTSKLLRVSLYESDLKWTTPLKTILTDFKKLRPDAHLVFLKRTSTSDNISNIADIEALLTMEEIASDEFERIKLRTAHFDLCVGPSHRLYSMDTVPISELRDERFITSGYTFMYEHLISMGVRDRYIILDRDNIDIRRQLIESGNVLAMSSSTFRSLHNKYGSNIKFIPLDPPLAFDQCLYFPKAKIEKKPILAEFVSYIRGLSFN